MLLLALLLVAQDPFPRPGADATGIVIDEKGQPIAGARITVRRRPGAESQWNEAIDRVLAVTPIPSVTSARDGEFVLPLNRDHRRLGLAGEAKFVVTVEKPGFQTWNEPLPYGLWGWLGSRVVLRELRQSDTITCVIAAPPPDTRLLLRRVVGADAAGTEIVPVPAAGKVEVRMPLLPWPPLLTGHEDWQPIRIEAQLLHPGRSTKARAIDPRQVVQLELGAARGPASRVERSDARPLTGLRARYRFPDGSQAWIPLPGGEVPHDEVLIVTALVADGCRTSERPETMVLHPLETPPPEPPVRERQVVGQLGLLIHDGEGRPIVGATVLLSPRALAEAPMRGPLPATDAKGRLVLDDLQPGHHSLIAIGDGHLSAQSQFQIHAGQGTELDLTLVAASPRRVVSVGINDQSVPFAPVVLVQANQPRWGNALHTDSCGRLLVPVARDEDSQIQLQERWGANTPIPLATDEPARVPCLGRVPLLVHTEHDVWITRDERRRGGGGSGTHWRGQPRNGISALLVRGLVEAGEILTLGVFDAPAFQLSADDIPEDRRSGFMPVEIDRSRITRVVPLRLDTGDGRGLDTLQLAPWTIFHSGAMTGPGAGNHAQRQPDGTWAFVARDGAPYRCTVMHPDYLPTDVTIPARPQGNTAEPAVEVRLLRGVAIRIRIAPKTPPNLLAGWNAQVRDKKTGRFVLWTFGPGPQVAEADLGKPIVLTLPHGFAPGEYTVQFAMNPGYPNRTREITLTAGKPAVLDMDQE